MTHNAVSEAEETALHVATKLNFSQNLYKLYEDLCILDACKRSTARGMVDGTWMNVLAHVETHIHYFWKVYCGYRLSSANYDMVFNPICNMDAIAHHFMRMITSPRKPAPGSKWSNEFDAAWMDLMHAVYDETRHLRYGDDDYSP